jgi:hypothetical protein
MGLESYQLNAKPKRRRQMKRSKVEQVRTLLERNPRMKTADVMKALGTTKSYTYVLMSKARSSYQKEFGETIEERMIRLRDMARRRAIAVAANPITNLPKGMTVADVEEIVTDVNQAITQHDAVNNPAHYTAGGIETIDFIEAKKLGYNLGNVVKYITRADHKGNKLEDLRKAQWYLSREIATLK